MEEILERAEERDMMESYMAPRRAGGGGGGSNDVFGFVVKDAPWNAGNPPPNGQDAAKNKKEFVADAGNDNEFPGLGLKPANGGQKAWGPWGAH